MKKVLLVVLCCMCFCGCGEKKEDKKEGKDNNQSTYTDDKVEIKRSETITYSCFKYETSIGFSSNITLKISNNKIINKNIYDTYLCPNSTPSLSSCTVISTWENSCTPTENNHCILQKKFEDNRILNISIAYLDSGKSMTMEEKTEDIDVKNQEDYEEIINKYVNDNYKCEVIETE